jgi:hypothetical protein
MREIVESRSGAKTGRRGDQMRVALYDIRVVAAVYDRRCMK